MTRTHHVTHSYTAARIDRMRSLLAALKVRPLARDEIGAVLAVGPSGVRKYLVDLRGMYEVDTIVGEEFVRLAVGDEATRAFIEGLEKTAVARQGRKAPAIDPSRHIHIMRDDVHFPVRALRGIPAREPMMAHFYGMARAEVRA